MSVNSPSTRGPGGRQLKQGRGHGLGATAVTGETTELSRGYVRSAEVSHRGSQSRGTTEETKPRNLISAEWGESKYLSGDRNSVAMGP